MMLFQVVNNSFFTFHDNQNTFRFYSCNSTQPTARQNIRTATCCWHRAIHIHVRVAKTEGGCMTQHFVQCRCERSIARIALLA